MLYLWCLEPDRDMQSDICLWKIAGNLDKPSGDFKHRFVDPTVIENDKLALLSEHIT